MTDEEFQARSQAILDKYPDDLNPDDSRVDEELRGCTLMFEKLQSDLGNDPT